MQTIRTGVMIGIVLIMTGISTVIGISMWPYLSLIGQVATMFTFVIFGCAGWLAIAGTRQLVGIMSARRRKDDLYSRTIINGEVVAVLNRNGEVMAHLSAMHEQAKVLQIAAPAEEEEDLDVNAELILEMYGNGNTYKTIEKSTGASYHRVQKVVTEGIVTGKVKKH